MPSRITRRSVLAGASTIAAAAGMPLRAATSAVRSFVLVHGGWHGGWCWRRVADRLRAKGHAVFTPTLTGLGERSHLMSPAIRLDTHVSDVANVIKWEGLSNIVLVGHSYGGCVISGVAERNAGAIGSIVFLDAFVPENGEAVADLASQAVREGIQAAVKRGDVSMAPVPAANFRVNEADRAWVDASCTPQPIHPLTDKNTITGARDRIGRKTYIRAVGYPSTSFDAAYAKVRSNASWRTFEVASGHDVMIDMPDRLSEILLAVA
jgi:pimeloyl-ACP methyl ester carboxylesterase